MSIAGRTLQLLRQNESRNVTFMEPDGSWPIVWDRARGVHVWDTEGRRYLDMTAAFGVAAAGHANPAVVRAGTRQMSRLLHAMGDVHPHPLKAELARELSRITFERWRRAGDQARHGKVIFCNSGFEAVEAALKTALLATGKPGVIAFEGAYHGLGHGALNTTHRDHFRGPFVGQLGRFGHFVKYPESDGDSSGPDLDAIEDSIRRLTRRHSIGAVLVEPVQGRGGIRIPPSGFLSMLRKTCDDLGIVFIADEVFTGFGRTGKWFACEHDRTRPDLICLGKGLTGGFPLSACVGRADLMDAAWPASDGEAIHTSTFLGHPVGCAMALVNIKEIRQRKLVVASAQKGRELLRLAQAVARSCDRLEVVARGIGLMAGLELRNADGTPATTACLRVVKQMLHRGFIVLPEGEHANVISLTPPLIITRNQMARTLRTLERVLSEIPRTP